MSIRLLARDLYRLQQRVDRLETELANASSPDRREDLQAQLRAARAERNQLRRVLDGQKDTPSRPRG